VSRLTEYFTATHHAPVREIAESTRTGPATTILSGTSAGLESSVYAIIAIALAPGPRTDVRLPLDSNPLSISSGPAMDSFWVSVCQEFRSAFSVPRSRWFSVSAGQAESAGCS